MEIPCNKGKQGYINIYSLEFQELPEFDRRVLEVLREPIESGHITISRAARQAEFPARFQLLAAMNPCPCGYSGDSSGRCHCTAEQTQRYRARISGPLLDRIDMHIEVPAVPLEKLRARQHQTNSSDKTIDDSQTIKRRVSSARDRQLMRAGKANHQLSSREIDEQCRLEDKDYQLLEQASQRLGLSARAYHRILKVARTIADLDDQDTIHTKHLTEAISYRRLDRGSIKH